MENNIMDKVNEKVLSDKPFDETNTDEGAIKKILNELLHFIVFFDSFRWGQIHDELNEGIVGKKVGSKDCYRIGFIDYLKQFARNNNIFFAKDGSKLFVYSGESWIVISEDLLKGFLHRSAKQMGIPVSLSGCVKFIKGTYDQLLESGFFEKMVQSDVTYLNLLNGTLKIDTNGVKLIPFNPKYFLTHQLEFKYTKNIVNQIWLNFLDTVLPDKETQKTLQQAIGYLFISDLKLEKVIFLYGIGSNGKSVIFEVIKGLLSADMMTNYSLESLTNHLGYQLADLNNKLINYGTDISMKNVDIAILKQIASGEPIGTRQIREKAFTMKSYAKLIFNVNKLDDADVENTNGFGRRLLFVPFEQVIEEKEQDKNLHKKLLENKTGIKFDFSTLKKKKKVNVGDALADLPSLKNGDKVHSFDYKHEAIHPYAKIMRKKSTTAIQNLVTESKPHIVDRYKVIKQGENWEAAKRSGLLKTYSSTKHTHSGIYKRLEANKPAVTIANYRKSMLIHPYEDRGLSLREAARPYPQV